MQVVDVIAEAKHGLDSGEIDPQVALQADDRPKPADFERFIPFDVLFGGTNGADESAPRNGARPSSRRKGVGPRVREE